MRRFRDRENYDNYERDNFDREDLDRGASVRSDNNFDRMYDSRNYSRDNDSRRYDERNYQRQGDYAEDGYRYQSQDRGQYEAPARDYRESRYARYEERPEDGYYRNTQNEPRQSVTNVNGNQVVFSSPKSYSDIQKLIDSLKKKQSLIVDVSDLDSANTQRYLDFLSGAIYALNGSYQKIDSKKFYFAPQGVSITIPYDLRRDKE